MESFIGHMKDKLEYSDCTSIDELRVLALTSTFTFTTPREQWTLKKMTPNQHRNHLLTT
ncbi:IS3 family transposase [Paenibacillus dendritiformis]|uniref:IS3 family transposase n=1 Tax=Paenibacillus TaxID=44249 RepID=UPI000DA7ECE9|nr:hypothetical protein DOE73_16240 [Paenibacillus dendritiformis]